MEKLRKGDQNRTARNEAHCSYTSRDESKTPRRRLCQRLGKFWGKKAKNQAQNLTPADVQATQLGVESSDKNEVTREAISGYNLGLFISGESLQNDQKETKWSAVGLEVGNKWEAVENESLIGSSSPERKSIPDAETSNDSVPPTEVSSTSAVIVVDDSKCDTSWKPPGFQTGLEIISSLLNSTHEDDVSVESQQMSNRSSGNVNDLIPSGSMTAEDLAETLAAHIAARERQASAALSFSSSVAKEVTEWKRDLSLRTDSTESLLGWLTGPSASLKCVDESNPQPNCHGSAGCFASNIHLSNPVLPEDDVEEQELEADELIEEEIIEEDDEEGAVTVEPNDPLSEAALSSASLRASFRANSSRTTCWKSHLVDATTSIPSTLALPKAEVSTTMTPTISRLRAADVTHFDELGFPSKRHGVRVKWGGGWSSTNKENSTTKIPNAVSSISFASPSGRASSPGLSMATLDSLPTLTFPEQLEPHFPRPAHSYKDTEAVQKLTQLLEELSADEQPWVRVNNF